MFEVVVAAAAAAVGESKVELELAHGSMVGDGCEGDSIFLLMFAEEECVILVETSSLLLLLRFSLDFMIGLMKFFAVLFGRNGPSCDSDGFSSRTEGWRTGGDFFMMNCTSLAYSAHLLMI